MDCMLKKSLLVIYLSIFLSGCGQSGPLYLPDQTENHTTVNNDN